MTRSNDSIKDVINARIDDAVWRFVHRSRFDNVLPANAIGEAIANGDITVDDIIERFGETITEHLGDR